MTILNPTTLLATSPIVSTRTTHEDLLYFTAATPLANRTVPGAEEQGGSIDTINLVFIVGLALVITLLARYLSTRGRRK